MTPIRECDVPDIVKNLGFTFRSATRVEYGYKQLAEAMRDGRAVFVGELHINIVALNAHTSSTYLSAYTRLRGKANYQFFPGTANANTNIVFDLICVNTSSTATQYDLDDAAVIGTQKTLFAAMDLGFKVPFCNFSGYLVNVDA